MIPGMSSTMEKQRKVQEFEALETGVLRYLDMNLHMMALWFSRTENQYYIGTVAKFEEEAVWYRVVYADGDFEDLEWHELEEVLGPLDIQVPLKSLAMKIIGKNQRLIQKSGKEVPTCGKKKTCVWKRQGICLKKHLHCNLMVTTVKLPLQRVA